MWHKKMPRRAYILLKNYNLSPKSLLTCEMGLAVQRRGEKG
jgi:hypothetical protein